MASEPHLSALGGHELMTGLLAVLVALIAFFRWLLGLAGARQDKRIAALEAEREQERNRMMAITQALMTLMAVVERGNPDEPALIAAKTVLKKAFPADAPDHSED